ncbi:MAG: TolC family protein [Calditrichaceae bacterium]
MTKYFKNISGLLILFFMYSSLSAQSDRLNLSLEDALKRAEENNHDIKIATAQVDGMRADYNSTSAIFLPQITLSETYVKTNDPLVVFGLKLKQEIVTQADFNPALLNDPDNFENFVTKLEINQPLINLDGFWGRSAASDGLSAMKFRKMRTENYIEFMVKLSYYKVGLMEASQDVVEQALEAAMANRRLIKDYFEEGLITKADYLMAEVFVSNLESQKTDMDNQRLNSSDQLRQMLGIEDDLLIVPTDTLKYAPALTFSHDRSSILENRSDLRAYGKQVAATEKMLTMNRMKFLPRLNAFGSYELNDSEVYGSGAENWMVGVDLRWNLFNGFQNVSAVQKSKADLNVAKYEYGKAKSQAENEIKAAARDLRSAEKKLELAKKIVEQSKESLRIIKDRYAQGLEKTTDLLNAETAFSNAELSYIKTLYFYNVSIFNLELMSEEKIEY